MRINLFPLCLHFFVTFLAIIIGIILLADFSNGYEGILLMLGVLLVNVITWYLLPKEKRLFVKDKDGEKK